MKDASRSRVFARLLSADLHLDVLVGVMLTGFFGVVDRMDVMPLRNVRMVPSLLMIPSFMVVGCSSMMTSGVFVVLSSFAMVLSGFFGHGKTSDAV